MDAVRLPSSPNPDEPPVEHPMRQRLVEETVRRTGKQPYEWQLKNTEDRLDGKDTLVIARTGAGRLLPFAKPAFVLDKLITWVLAPLSYMQGQRVGIFKSWGVSVVCVEGDEDK